MGHGVENGSRMNNKVSKWGGIEKKSEIKHRPC